MIQVVCGIIKFNDNDILISKRSLHKNEYPGIWELPGGKVNDNETNINALKREIKEELDLEVVVDKLIYCIKHFNNKYDVWYYQCLSECKKIKLNNEVETYKFINKKDYDNYKMMPNDKFILNYIKSFQ
jgi:8-oxo-dGTP diphosphatase